MRYSCVTYRTPGNPYHRYAVVPNLFLPDLLDWLKLSEFTITSLVRARDTQKLLAPEEWPSYGHCKGYIHSVELLGLR